MEQKNLSRRTFLTLVGAGMAGSVLAACAPAGSSTGGDAPAAEGGSNEFVLWGLQYDPHIERYNALAAAFEEKTGLKAIVQPQAWPLETKLLAAITAGTQPDVVCVMGIVSIPLFTQKAVIEMNDVVYDAAGVKAEEFFYPEALQAYTWDGKFMGVPLESNQVGQSVGVRYDFLDEIGDEAKALWPGLNGKDGFDSYEEMWALAELLKKTEGDTVTRWGLSGQGWDLGQYLTTMRSLGQDFWDPNLQKFNFDTEAAVAAMQLYIETPVQRGIEAQLDDHHMNLLFAGKVGVAMGNTAMAPEGEKLGLTVESVNRPPAIAGKETLYVGEGGWGFEIPTRAKNMDAAIEFCKWMATREGQVIYAQIYGGVVPATPSVLDDAIYQGDDLVKISRRRAIGALPNTVYYGNDWGLNRTGSDVPLTQCRQGALSAQAACTELQTLMTANFDQWKESMQA
ncbi:MAG: extracellular solute-binding protein [Caldilineaceae bacterium]|nr:extracellular solute-binding protein [Caldilineaceae bacterium]